MSIRAVSEIMVTFAVRIWKCAALKTVNWQKAVSGKWVMIFKNRQVTLRVLLITDERIYRLA